MVILVSGGAGYIGSRLIRDLGRHPKFGGDTVRVLDNMMRERYVALMDLPEKGHFEFLEGDIRRDDDLKKAFVDVDMVIDLAGITNAPLSFERKDLTFDVNVAGGKKMVEHAVKAGVEKFVYSSTASVYGPTKGVVNEEHDCKPLSPYGESKLQAEKFCIEASRDGRLNGIVLRLGTVHGYSIGMRFDTVVDRFAYLAAAHMPLSVWESALNEKRPYLHVADASEALVFALTDKALKAEVYNVVGENASIDRIVNVIRKQVPDVEVVVTPTPNLNQVSYELDSSKVEKAGFHPKHSLDDGVHEIIDKFRTLVRSRQTRKPATQATPKSSL